MDQFETREAWLEARRHSLGASESPVALGLSPWQSPFNLWAVKTGRIPPDDLSGVEAVEWGLRLERPIGEAFAERSERVVQFDEQLTIRRHRIHPWLSCTLDATQFCEQYDGPGVLQIKTANAFKRAEWEQGPPLYYRVQVVQEMAVTGYTWGSLVVLIGGNKLMGPYDIHWDDAAWDIIEPRLVEFWRNVETDTPPEVDASESTEDALKKLHPDDNGQAVELGEDAEELADRRDDLSKQIAKLTDERRGVENKLKALMEGNTYGLLPSGGKLTYKTTERSSYTVAAAKYRTLRRSKK